jgi:DNA phosphorothioation-dependent restriction protein DptH
MLPKGSTDLIARAFEQIIGNGREGDVAYASFLPSHDIDKLCADCAFASSGWSIFGVTDRNDEPRRMITADHAVELRERKANALLLLIDRERAGAGLDGIYSAAREVKEAELLEAAVSLARASVGHGLAGFAREAIRRSRLGGRRNLNLWRVFDFYVGLAAGTLTGAAVLSLGLWPIQSETPAELLSESEHMVFRLFVGRERDATIQDLVASLLIDDSERASELADFLREVRHLDRFAAIDRLASRPGVWLGVLRPRVHGEILRSMELVPWRGRQRIPLKWSGLRERDEELVLVLDRRPDAKSPGRLEVRWRTTPDKLREGAATYTVEICSDDDVLASGQLTHRGENPQKFAFALDDFESLESDQVFEPVVRISAQGTEPLITEIFRLEFGEAPERGIGGSAGRRVRCVGEGLLAAREREDFDLASREAHTKPEAEKKVFLLWRSVGPVAKPFKVYRPPLLREIEETWHQREQGAIGRWSVRVTSEGKRLESPEFHKFEPGASNMEAWRRFESASQRIARELGEGFGVVARAFAAKWAALDEYLLAWLRVIPSATPELALVNTVEVKGLSDRFEGLIVLPLHPLRLAWHAAYESLAAHARYEEGMTPTSVEETLRVLDSANFPWMLPGIAEGHTLVFGDTLGFHATAMISEDALEPKGAVSLLARCLSDGDVEVAPSVGQQTAKVLAGEIDYYLRLHPQTSLLNLQALRAGDGMTIARALGQIINGKKPAEDDASRQGPIDDSETGVESDSDEPNPLCFALNLLESEQGICGRFLLEVANSRRASGIVGERDRWIVESVERNGGVTVPRLRWARKRESEFTSSAHLAVAFDTFQSQVEALPVQSISSLERPGRAYGLVATIERQVSLSPIPTWRLFQAQRLTGQKHPAQRSLTERLTDIQIALSNAVVRNLGADPATSWPVLVTKLKAEDHERFERLHRNSGWVITADRNACIEYFDSPRDQPAIYDAYLLDCVPEREDLGTVQLVTSTTHKEELYGVFESVSVMPASTLQRKK